MIFLEGAGLAPCVMSVLGLLGGGVRTCVSGFLVGVVRRVEGGGLGGGVMEGGVWEAPSRCPRVQGGRGSPLRLYGVSLVMSSFSHEDVGGRQLIHLRGVGEVAGDGDLGGVVLAGGGVGNDLVSRPFVVGGVLHCVHLEWGVEWLRRWGLFLGFRVGCHFGFDQVLRARGFGAPTWVAAATAACRRAVVLVSRGGGGWLWGEGVVVLVRPPNGVASLGVAVRGLRLGLLDGQCGRDVLRYLWVYGCGVCP